MALQKSSTDTNYIDSPEFGDDALTGLSYLLPGAGQLISGLFGVVKGKKALGEATGEFESSLKNAPAFQIAPEIKQDLAQREAEYNAEDEAIKQAKADILQQQANYFGNVERNAQSGAQAINAMAGGSDIAQKNIARLATQQFANKIQKGQGLSNARANMAQQRSVQFADQQAKNEAMQNLALGKMQAERYNVNEGNKNIFGGLPGFAMGLASLLKKNDEGGSTGGGGTSFPIQYKMGYGNTTPVTMPSFKPTNLTQPITSTTPAANNLPGSVPTNQSLVMNNPLPAGSGLAAPVNPYANPWNMQNASLINRPFGSVGPTYQNFDDLPIDIKMKIEAERKRRAYEESPMGSVPLNPSMMIIK